MGEGLRQAEDCLCLVRRFDRGDERLSRSTRDRPVARELRRWRGLAAGEFLGESDVQLLALAGKDCRVDRLGQQRVAEAEGVARRLGHEQAMLDRLAQRLAHIALRQLRRRPEQGVSDVASGRGGQAQHALRWTVELGHAP